jgi:hypothetical protein
MTDQPVQVVPYNPHLWKGLFYGDKSIYMSSFFQVLGLIPGVNEFLN